MKAKTRDKKELEYFEKMKDTILEDLKDGRDASALAGSIGRSTELLYKYMKLWGVKDLYGEPSSIAHECSYYPNSRTQVENCLICEKPLAKR